MSITVRSRPRPSAHRLLGALNASGDPVTGKPQPSGSSSSSSAGDGY